MSRIAVVIAIGALVMACAGGSASLPAPSATPAASPTTTPAQAMVRFLDAAPDARAVDIYLDGTRVDRAMGMAFGTITDYQGLVPGPHAVTVYPAGAEVATTAPLVTQTLAATPGSRTTLAVTDLGGGGHGRIVTDGGTPTAGTTQLRFVDLGAGPNGVDVVIDGRVSSPFKGVSQLEATGYEIVPPGPHHVQLRDDPSGRILVSSEPVTLDAGDSDSLFAIGASSGATDAQRLRLLLAVDDSVSTNVRLLNASPDAGPVDAWVDGTRATALAGIAFGTVSASVRIPAGSHHIDVVDAGQDPDRTTPILGVDVVLGAARRHTLAISGLEAVAQPTLFTDPPRPAAGRAEMRIIALSADTPAIDAGPVGEPPMVTDLAYGHASRSLEVPAGTFDLLLRATGESRELKPVDRLTLAKDTSYTAILVGSSAGGAGAQPLGIVLVADAGDG